MQLWHKLGPSTFINSFLSLYKKEKSIIFGFKEFIICPAKFLLCNEIYKLTFYFITNQIFLIRLSYSKGKIFDVMVENFHALPFFFFFFFCISNIKIN